MSNTYDDPYARGSYGAPVAARAEPNARIDFIRRTYGHLAGAILAFVALLLVFFAVTTVEMRAALVVQMFGNPVYLIVLMVAFIGCGYLAQWWAMNATSPAMQYAGLGLYVLLQAVIFMPILVFAADRLNEPGLIGEAGILTGVVFGGLTIGVFVTKKDFSFLRGFLWIAGFLALGIIICACIPGLGVGLGMWFSVLMIGLACLYILYDTSNVMLHYRTDQHVAAALALFASVALLFFYILRLLMQNRGSN